MNAILNPIALPAWELPPQPLAVRPLDPDDLRHLEWHGGPDLRAWYEEALAAHRAGEVLYLVADFNGFPMGQVLVHWSGKTSLPSMPDLQSLRVHLAFRGLGIGSRLLQAAEECVQAGGFAQVSLSVGVQNPHAQRLYERSGYHVAGAPYHDSWSTINARGETVHFAETIRDMVKDLAALR